MCPHEAFHADLTKKEDTQTKNALTFSRVINIESMSQIFNFSNLNRFISRLLCMTWNNLRT